MLAQLTAASPNEIKAWLIVAIGLLGAAVLVKQLLPARRSPPLEAEFVSRADHAKDIERVNKDVESLRGKFDRDAEKIINKIDEAVADLKMEASLRRKTIYEKIDQCTHELSRRMNDLDKNVSRIDERTGGKHHGA
jgi:hypothetical protein